MALYNTTERKLEDNLRHKECELLHLVEENVSHACINYLHPNRCCFIGFCECFLSPHVSMHQLIPSPSPPPSLHSYQTPPPGYWIPMDNPYLNHSPLHHNPTSTPEARPNDLTFQRNYKPTGHNIQYSPAAAKEFSETRENQIRARRSKNNKNKIFSSTKICPTSAIDYSKVVVNLSEIGLVRRRVTFDANRLIRRLRQLFTYLTTLSKQRSTLESIILSKEIISNGKYILSASTNVAGHVNYALQSLSNEIGFIDKIFLITQQKGDDVFSTLCRGPAKNMLSTLNLLTTFNGPELGRNVNNTDFVRDVDNVLTAVITQVRYMSAVYLITAQKLLFKETTSYECRRRTFMGR